MIYKEDFPDIKWVLNEHGAFPSTYSDNACNIIKKHYFAKGEESFFDVVKRVASMIAESGYRGGYFPDAAVTTAFAKRLGGYMLRQQAAFNSPVYYNVGVTDKPQCSACFIQSVEDTMESILDLAKKEGMLFKYGSGTGTNLSALRHKGALLSCGGEASGPVAFMRLYDAGAGVVKSGGRTRRAAKMVLLDHNHPDVEEFIWCKAIEDRVARKLIADGMDETEAYDRVRFQNGNNSVRVSDEFMRAATSEYNDLVAASPHSWQLDMMAQAAWECGDPGIQFIDEVQTGLPVEVPGKINASNPCSEYLFLDDSACNLASINIQMLDPMLQPARFQQCIETFITAMDIIVDMSGYPTPEIEANSKKYRPLGLGLTGVGAYLMTKGLAYGGDRAFQELKTIARDLWDYAYAASEKLAEQLGSPWGGEVRNAQLTLMAPTGTISFMLDAESTGIEPVVAESTVKYLSDGTTMEIIPACVKYASQKWGDHVVKTALGHNPVDVEGHLNMMAAMQPYLSGGISKTINMPSDCTWEDVRDVYVKAWEMGLKSIAIYRDESKANQPVKVKRALPAGAALENVLDGDLRMTTLPVNVEGNGRVKLPDTRDSITHKFTVGGIEGYLTVGLYAEGYPGEIFLNISKEGSTIGGMADAWATAFSMGLQYGVPLEKLVRKFKGSSFSPAGFTGSDEIRAATSIVDYIASWLEVRFLGPDDIDIDDEESDTDMDFAGEYDEGAGTFSGNVCPECGKFTVRTGSCTTCPHCGWNGGCG